MRFPEELKFDADMAQAVKISPQHIHKSEAHDAHYIPTGAHSGRGGECAVTQEALW